jgi:hypothetical protein
MFEKFASLINNPLKFRLFLLMKLPAAFFSGVRVKYFAEGKCVTVVPYKWFSQNPFNSTYFACLAMAGEMSTGVLAMGHTYKRNPKVSMLVKKIEGNFMKKASGDTFFTCDDGNRIKATILSAIASGQSATLTTYASGKNKDGEPVAEFNIQWSFKVKSTASSM